MSQSNGIGTLPVLSSLSASESFGVSKNGSKDYQVETGAVVDYIRSNLTVSGQFITQKYQPVTGETVQVNDNSNNTWLVLTPTGTLATLTIKLPLKANVANHQEVWVVSTQTLTALTIDGNGATVNGAPTTLAANGYFRMRYDLITPAWYRVG